jgi:aminoglycoside 3-N-acetyltransferase
MLTELKVVARKRFGLKHVDFLKDVRRKFRKFKRSIAPKITKEQLIQQLSDAGIKQDDVLVVHSSLASLGNIEGGAKTVIDVLKLVVGKGGTLVIPSYVGFSRLKNAMASGEVVDLRTEPGCQGAIPEIFRLSDNVFRSSHPFSSCCAWGKQAEYITSGHEGDDRICHKESPLGKVLELKGKVLALGVNMVPISLYHVVEDTWDDYPLKLYDAPFSVQYIDQDGKLVERNIRSYMPQVQKTRIDSDSNLWLRKKIASEFDRRNYRKKFTFGVGKAWCVDAEVLYDLMIELASQSLTIYTTKQEWDLKCR